MTAWRYRLLFVGLLAAAAIRYAYVEGFASCPITAEASRLLPQYFPQAVGSAVTNVFVWIAPGFQESSTLIPFETTDTLFSFYTGQI